MNSHKYGGDGYDEEEDEEPNRIKTIAELRSEMLAGGKAKANAK